MYVHPQGSPSSRIWVACEKPLPSDIGKGYLFSGGLGWVYMKMFEAAQIDPRDVYFCCRQPDTDTPNSYSMIEQMMNQYKPPFIILLDEVGQHFLSVMKLRDKKGSYMTELNKQVGSLLTSDLLNYPHYAIPLYGPDKVNKDWAERNIVTYFDLQKLREELFYYKQHGIIQQLPHRQLVFHDMELDEIFMYLNSFYQYKMLSADIESVYPKADSLFRPHPGYPTTLGLAPSKSLGISFNLFRESTHETILLWRKLDDLFSKVSLLGQNFFNFDSHFLNALGFNIDLTRVVDTLIRHSILWPELPHKLQFQTRQYTREPYYKDEGKIWSMKDMKKLRRYNCLDCCITYEIYEEQETEFQLRPWLAA